MLKSKKKKPFKSEKVKVLDFVDDAGNSIDYEIEVRSVTGAVHSQFEYHLAMLTKDKSREDWIVYHMATEIAKSSFSAENGKREFTAKDIEWIIDSFTKRDFNSVYEATQRVNNTGDDEKKSLN